LNSIERRGLGFSGSGRGPVTRCCEHGDKLWGSFWLDEEVCSKALAT